MPKVSLIRTESYDQRAMDTAVSQHLDALGFLIPSSVKTIVIKPNLIMKCTPERTATTHPAMVAAVCRYIREHSSARIILADSPGGLYTPQIMAGVYAATGMKQAAQKFGVELYTACVSRPVQAPDGQVCKDFDILAPILDADMVFNLCKLKTHCMTTLSCGVKNLFGCVPGLLKPQLHYRFPEGERFAGMLLDLAGLVKPAVTLVDAVDAMEGDGPTAGQKRHVGLTAAAVGEDIYALDLVMGRLIGLSPQQVPMLAQAVERGLCPKTVDEVSLCGNGAGFSPIQDFRMPATKGLDFADNIPRPFSWIVRGLGPRLAPHPKIRVKDCVGCGKCAESCPAKTIEILEGKAKINLSNCIHCFCCHEMCPAKAINVKANPIFQMFSKR